MPDAGPPPSESTPAVVLLSGGLDSAVVLALATSQGRACRALSIDYGQRHRRELQAARAVADSQRARHLVVALDLRSWGGSALTGPTEVPKDRAEVPNEIPSTYVPARNLIFLSLATAWAEVLGAPEIHVGVNAVDYSGYPDCRPEFVASFEQTARLATKVGVEGRGVRVVAPLVRLSKAEIIRLGRDLGVAFELTWSCYDPVAEGTGRACGRCDSCGIRRRGFVEAGVPDPTPYVR